MNYIYFLVLFIIGTFMGSFYLLVASRMPKDKSIVKPSSHCEFCKKPLKWYDLIPVFSYLIQTGKCRYCHKKIPISYLITEFITGLAFGFSYLLFSDFGYGFFISLIILSLTVIIFISDFKYLIIPDQVLIAATFLISIIVYLYFGIDKLLVSLLAGLISFGVMYLVKIIGDYAFKTESMGGADIKLMFISGLLVGVVPSSIVLFIASVLAMPVALFYVKKKQTNILPFGPFIIIGIYLVFIFNEPINQYINFYLSVF